MQLRATHVSTFFFPFIYLLLSNFSLTNFCLCFFIQFQRLQQQQMMRGGVWGHGKMEYQFQNVNMNGGGGRNQGLSMAAWPTLQQSQHQPGAGMRAVFLADTGAKKERNGTGVFLPRRIGANPTETRKKPGNQLPNKTEH